MSENFSETTSENKKAMFDAEVTQMQNASELLLQKAKFFSALTECVNALSNLLGAATEKIRNSKD